MCTDAHESRPFNQLPLETVEQHRKSILRALLRHHHTHDAEDLTQDMLLRAVIEGVVRAPSKWLSTGTRWASCAYFRSTRRRDLGRRVDPESVPDDSDPFAQVEQEDLRETLQHALDRLAPALFRIVRYRMDGESVTAVARKLGCSEQTVRNKWKEALRQLRLSLADAAG